MKSMKTIKTLIFILVTSSIAALLAGFAHGANVNPRTGYTNDFSAQPLAADWSTRGFGSTGTKA